MRLSIALVAAAAIGIGGVAAGSSPTAANPSLQLTPLVHQGAETANPAIEEVQYRRRHVRRHGGFAGRRHFRQRHSFGPRRHVHRFHSPRRHVHRFHSPRRHAFRHHHRRHHGGAAAAGLFGFALGAMAGQAFAGPGYHSAHVEWCLQRYRSYDIRTDTFLSFDGFRYRCNSPYQY